MKTANAFPLNTPKHPSSNSRRALPTVIGALLAIGISTPSIAGTLSFNTSKIYPLGPAATGIDVADINNDGKQDVIGAGKTDGSLNILFGNGDGTFAASINYPETGPILNHYPFVKIIAKDVNPLLHGVEINVLNEGGISQLTFSNNAALGAPPQGFFGLFETNLVTNLAGGDRVDFALEDFNHDGIFDEASASFQAFFEVDLRGKNQRFGLNSSHIFDGGEGAINRMLTGDLNLDSNIDVITLETSQMNVSLGKRDGSYPSKTVYGISPGLSDAAMADFNKDGKPDVIMTNAQHRGGSISLFLGNGKGGFKSFKSFTAKDAHQRPSHIAISDLNADGNMDVIVSFLDNSINNAIGSNELGVFLGNGDGTFKANVNFIVGNLPAISTDPGQIIIKDVNQDSKPDVLVATVSGVAVLLNSSAL